MLINTNTSFLILMAGRAKHAVLQRAKQGVALAAERPTPLTASNAMPVGALTCRARRAGTLSCKPNAKYPRDLDIVLHYEFAGKNSSCTRTQPYRMR